jgi:hypothetical protein
VATAVLVAVPASATAPDCTSTAAIASFSYTVNGHPVTDLNLQTDPAKPSVHAGDLVVAHFTIAQGCENVTVTFATYSRPGGTTDVTQQVLSDHQTGTFSAGDHTLQATLPCSWQADLAMGEVINKFDANTFYGDRLKDSGWGTEQCVTPSPTSSIEASSTPNPSSPTPTGGINSSATPSEPGQSVLGASVTNPNTGSGSQAFGGFVAILMVLTGIAVLAEMRRRRQRD